MLIALSVLGAGSATNESTFEFGFVLWGVRAET